MSGTLRPSHRRVLRGEALTLILCLICSSGPLSAQIAPSGSSPVPSDAPSWVAASYKSLIDQALPESKAQTSVGPSIPQFQTFPNDRGILANYQPAGATATATNAFFQSLGTNGRSCVTCHQPESAMSLSVRNIQEIYLKTLGTDPLLPQWMARIAPIRRGRRGSILKIIRCC
jgi:hypothetical protein